MAFNNHIREKIIQKIEDLFHSRLPEPKAKLLSDFVRQFYSAVAVEDLEAHPLEDLYGALLSHWELISKRMPGEQHLRVYNPEYEQHGWQSTHTIIELAQDDMPFLVDSMRMELNRRDITIHLIIHYGGIKLKRDKQGEVVEVMPFATPVGDDIYPEAPIYIEIDRQTDPAYLEEIRESLISVLRDVRCSVEDWAKMRSKIRTALTELEQTKLPFDPGKIAETKDFLHWIENDHFTFLGYRQYQAVEVEGEKLLKIIPGSGLGVLRGKKQGKKYQTFPAKTEKYSKARSASEILIITKTSTKATVHRPTFTDCIIVNIFDDAGNVIGQHRFIGLLTSAAYYGNPKFIPFVRQKVASIVSHSHLSQTGHAGKALMNILETFPRDDLFQAPLEELFTMVMGILHLQERKHIRVFARKDVYNRFISCLVFVPRDRFTTELANSIEKILCEAFQAEEITSNTRFSESVLAQIHYLARVNPGSQVNYDLKEIEQKIIEIARSWEDELKYHLLEHFGEEQGNLLFRHYRHAFPASYREIFSPRVAIHDISHIETLNENKPINIAFYRSVEETDNLLRFKLFRRNDYIPVSDALPVFENMGLRVINEKPHELTLANSEKVWISDFSMTYNKGARLDVDHIRDIFEDAFYHIWAQTAENDGFNKLILSASISWREISVLRAYGKYLKQTGFTYSQSYIEECFNKHTSLAKLLIDLFLARFEPNKEQREIAVNTVEEKIKTELDNITLLDEDRIIRRFHETIRATIRTNYFQKDERNKNKKYISFKFDPEKLSEMPLPLPKFEVFVYSPRLEGVHLRSSKVARGGIRWSDRREDFRTEILGLMKAQNVKNAVIVPSGAKGGFFPKNLPVDGTRDEIMEEVIYCYRTFISGLLDITDNRVGDEIVVPDNVVRYDDDDPYLVVAADKGTATFSDIANEISHQYNFWLGDAFASGGSTGYDHKKMAITARGAWESVKRHFRELGKDIQNENFTVVGIGDMAGDVFGNGMLLSEHICLVGAFNHLHIFVDPNPDPKISFEERKRLFHLPRSSWEDYNRELISKGGGVFRRTSKAIKLSPEIKTLLGIEKDFVVPNELIRALLKAKIDLLWNGGIGTFVKAESEEHSEAGDRANDAIRVNGNQLQCAVVGEGGNLGCTQLGRIEYALNGGRINTDFIDNSGGVDCSDHEVNIKILLNRILEEGDITLKQRNKLLAEMSNEVAELVLANNYAQTQAISVAAYYAFKSIDIHTQYMQDLADAGNINLALEFLPSANTLIERKAKNLGLTRPELAILFAYSKNIIRQEILKSDLLDDTYLKDMLIYEFPKPLRKKYRANMEHHRLWREIVALILSNHLVDEMGFTFIYQLQKETGANVGEITRAYVITRNVFHTSDCRHKIEKLDLKVPAEIQMQMFFVLYRLKFRCTRWLLRSRRLNLDINTISEKLEPAVILLREKIVNLLVGSEKERYEQSAAYFIEAKVPEEIAHQIAGYAALISAFDIIDAAQKTNFSLEDVAVTYFNISEKLQLGWFREQLYQQIVENDWEALAKEACRDDLDWQQKQLTNSVLSESSESAALDEKLENWMTRHALLVERWQKMISKLKATTPHSYVMFTVALRELMDLTQTSIQSTRLEEGKSEVSA